MKIAIFILNILKKLFLKFVKMFKYLWSLVKKIIYKLKTISIKTILITLFIPIFTLLLGLSQSLSNRSLLSFDFSGSAGGPIMINNTPHYQIRFEGIIKNQSQIKNTITDLALVVWGDKKENSVLRYGGGPDKINDLNLKQELKIPLIIEGREAKKVEIYYSFPIKGTSDEKLVTTWKQVQPGSIFYNPAYTYEIVFEDINKIEFDMRGMIVNRKVIDLNWTLENSCGQYHYTLLGCNFEKIKIEFSKITFKIKKIFYWLGIMT